MTTPDDHPIDYRQEHRGEVVVRDVGGLSAEQIIRAQAAAVAAHRLGPAKDLAPQVAIEHLIRGADEIAYWIRNGEPTDPAGSAS